jgi:predicted nucleic acid-binding protein
VIQSARRPGFVIDASVALKWFSQAGEEDLKAALRLRGDYQERKIDLFAPELLIYEAANVLRYKDIAAEVVEKAVSSLYAMDICIPVRLDTMAEAVRFARRFDVTVYDSVYFAFALASGCRMITADRQFLRKIADMPGTLHLSSY